MDLFINAGRLIDGTGADAVTDAVMRVEDGRVVEVGSAAQVQVPDGAQVVDASSHTVMPGMIDCHIHLLKANIRYFQNYQLATVITHPTMIQMYALRSAQIMLEAGFTTIKNQPHFMPWEPRSEMYGVAVRDAIRLGLFPGTRIVSGGYAHITNSHFDFTTPRTLPRFPEVTADGPWELRKLVRQILRGGADFIKTCLSGGGGTAEEPENIRNMTQEEIDAIVDEAHAFGKQCSAHCFTPLAQKMAMRADVDVLEHCVFTDDEAIEMMVGRGQSLVPTLSHRADKAIQQRVDHGGPRNVIEKMKRIQDSCWESFQRLHKAGVRIAMGTDTQIDPLVGENAEELEIYVDLGMTPMEAILTTTRNAAEAIWMPDVGTLEPGKLADFIVVDGNPLEDVRILQDQDRILQVYKGGAVAVDRTAGSDRAILRQPEFIGGEY